GRGTGRGPVAGPPAAAVRPAWREHRPGDALPGPERPAGRARRRRLLRAHPAGGRMAAAGPAAMAASPARRAWGGGRGARGGGRGTWGGGRGARGGGWRARQLERS